MPEVAIYTAVYRYIGKVPVTRWRYICYTDTARCDTDETTVNDTMNPHEVYMKQRVSLARVLIFQKVSVCRHCSCTVQALSRENIGGSFWQQSTIIMFFRRQSMNCTTIRYSRRPIAWGPGFIRYTTTKCANHLAFFITLISRSNSQRYALQRRICT